MKQKVTVDFAMLHDWFDYVVSVRRLHDTTSGRMENTVVATEAIAILDKTPEVEVVGHSEEKPCTNCVSWNCELHGKPDNAPCLPRPLYAIKETK
jgi:hypothetical protein